MYYVVTIFYIKPNIDIVTGELRVTGLYLRWDIPSPYPVASYELFISAFSYLSDRFHFTIFLIHRYSGYKHEPPELFYRRCLGARELSDQLHEDGGDRGTHWEDQV